MPEFPVPQVTHQATRPGEPDDETARSARPAGHHGPDVRGDGRRGRARLGRGLRRGDHPRVLRPAELAAGGERRAGPHGRRRRSALTAAAGHDRSAPRHGDAADVPLDRLDRAAVAVTGTYLEPAARWSAGGRPAAGQLRRGHPGSGRPVLALVRPTHPVTVSARPCRSATRSPRSTAAGAGDRGGRHRLRRARHHRPGAHLRQPARPGPRGARRRPGREAPRGHLAHRGQPVATYGYSQGGGASAAAAELQPRYAPDVSSSESTPAPRPPTCR